MDLKRAQNKRSDKLFILHLHHRSSLFLHNTCCTWFEYLLLRNGKDEIARKIENPVISNSFHEQGSNIGRRSNLQVLMKKGFFPL
jgi:hypothetical protein